MCVDYRPTSKSELRSDFLSALHDDRNWPDEVYQDYLAPIIRAGADGGREAVLGTYGFLPQSKQDPERKKLTTMNARSEEVGSKRTYKTAWAKTQLCLVPMTAFYEPNWETGKHIRYRIEMADQKPFAVAGLWKEWDEPDGQKIYSFTQLTINADEHPVMKHFHRLDDEKRSLVILHPEEYDDWLNCKDPERARSFMRNFPPELMAVRPEPKPARAKKTEILEPPEPSLF